MIDTPHLIQQQQQKFCIYCRAEGKEKKHALFFFFNLIWFLHPIHFLWSDAVQHSLSFLIASLWGHFRLANSAIHQVWIAKTSQRPFLFFFFLKKKKSLSGCVKRKVLNVLYQLAQSDTPPPRYLIHKFLFSIWFHHPAWKCNITTTGYIHIVFKKFG